MAPIPGWYQDPSDPGQLRYWDGGTWTAATGPMPRPRQAEPSVPELAMAAPAAAAPASVFTPPSAGPGFGYPTAATTLPAWGPAPQRSRFTTRAKVAVAAGLAAVVTAAVTVPLVMSSAKSPSLAKSFEQSLLTPGQVSVLANVTFTIDTSSDNNSNDNSSGGCTDAFDTIASGKDHGEASREFVAADHTTFIAEDLDSATNNPQELAQMKRALSSCKTTVMDGSTLSLQLLAAPQVGGSDDTLAFEMSGQLDGSSMVFVIDIARFGDNVVMVMTGGVDSSFDMRTLSGQLLATAVDTARPALSHRTA